MLKGIPEILSPELLKVLCEMGHSDRLVIADGNFPVESMGKNAITIRCDGHGVPEILDAILKLFPLDTYVEHPVNLMEVMPGDDVETPIWDTYKEIVSKHDERGEKAIGNIERFAFYDEAKTAYCIISTSEKALYANVMLQKRCCDQQRLIFLLNCLIYHIYTQYSTRNSVSILFQRNGMGVLTFVFIFFLILQRNFRRAFSLRMFLHRHGPHNSRLSPSSPSYPHKIL